MLSEQQQKFIEEFLIDLNATQSAIRAGYSTKGARTKGAQLLAKGNIRDEIERKKAERARDTKITSDRVLNEIGKIAFSDIRLFYDENGVILPPKKWPDEIAAAVASFEVTQLGDATVTKIKLWDKGKQLELAGKHTGLFDSEKNADKGRIDPVQVIFQIQDAST